MERKNERVNQSYYRINGNPKRSDVANYDVDLMVNCCGESLLRSGWRCQGVRRRNDFYLIYSLGGDFVGEIDGAPVSIKSGDVICIAPGMEYFFHAENETSERAHYFWLQFTGSEAESIVLRSGLTLGKVHSVGLCDEVFSFYEKLFSEFRSFSENFEYDAAVQLRYILYVFGRASRKNSASRLDKSMKYIYTHLRHEITVEELAAMEYMGVSRYRELFKSITGMSPIDYITRLRIGRAKDLLSQEDTSIEEVGEASGYPNRYYFQRIFKKHTGQTPGEYRKEIKR